MLLNYTKSCTWVLLFSYMLRILYKILLHQNMQVHIPDILKSEKKPKQEVDYILLERCSGLGNQIG